MMHGLNNTNHVRTSPPACNVLKDSLMALAVLTGEELRGDAEILEDVYHRGRLALRLSGIIPHIADH